VIFGQWPPVNQMAAGSEAGIRLEGSDIQAGRHVALIATNDIDLQAAAGTDSESSRSWGKSASVGVTIGTDGFGVTIAGSRNKGVGDALG